MRTSPGLSDRDREALRAAVGIVVCLAAISLLFPRTLQPRARQATAAPRAAAAEPSIDASRALRPEPSERATSGPPTGPVGSETSDAPQSTGDPRTPPPPPPGLPNKFALAQYDRPVYATFLEPEANAARSEVPAEDSSVPRRPTTADGTRMQRLTDESRLTDTIEVQAEAGSAHADE